MLKARGMEGIFKLPYSKQLIAMQGSNPGLLSTLQNLLQLTELKFFTCHFVWERFLTDRACMLLFFDSPFRLECSSCYFNREFILKSNDDTYLNPDSATQLITDSYAGGRKSRVGHIWHMLLF